MDVKIEERLSADQKAYLDRAFDCNAPIDDRVIEMRGTVRGACRQLAAAITFLPPTAERRKALENVEEAMFWAHACLSREANAIVVNLNEQER